MISKAMISACHFAATCLMICSQRIAIRPTSTARRYLGVHTQRYLLEYTTLWSDLYPSSAIQRIDQRQQSNATKTSLRTYSLSPCLKAKELYGATHEHGRAYSQHRRTPHVCSRSSTGPTMRYEYDRSSDHQLDLPA